MNTKVKKDQNSATLKNVFVEIPADEKESIKQFFSFRGMQKAFLDSHVQHLRRHLNASLYSGSYRIELLTDVRNFIEEHKHEVAEFIKPSHAA